MNVGKRSLPVLEMDYTSVTEIARHGCGSCVATMAILIPRVGVYLFPAHKTVTLIRISGASFFSIYACRRAKTKKHSIVRFFDDFIDNVLKKC
jgi:hypothetical protein